MRSGHAILLICGFTIFLGAALLFLLQLVFARLALPLLGGAPAVWNTAMVFYQAVLLAGYGYAHWMGRRGVSWRHLAIHAVVLLLPFAVLPFGIGSSWQVPPEGSPIPWLLGLLAISVGAPFFALSTTSPLLQRWFSATGHTSARDPYFLYAASNAGSLAALLSYPLLIEPHTRIRDQAMAWAAAFALLGLLSILCGVLSKRGSSMPAGEAAAHENVGITGSRRLRWLLCAAVPSSLMLSVTTYISSEIAAVPLLWVIPLALYLLTFILVFSKGRWLGGSARARILAPAVVAVVMVLAMGSTTPMVLLVSLHLGCFFIAALACHGRLAEDRPDSRRLTEFYLWMSLGGVIGGAFNALLAPVIFTSLAEYPLMLLAACWLVLPEGKSPPRHLIFALLPAAVAAGIALGYPDGEGNPALRQILVFGIPSLLCFAMSRDRNRFVAAIAALLVVAHLLPGREMRSLHATRSFFGIHRVTMDSKREFHYLFHGKTVHGLQSLDRARRRVPLGYYHPKGPLGDVFASRADGPVAAVGMGTGAVAAYGKTGQEFVFYEIDPEVKAIATDSRYFSYLADSPADLRVVIGDARLKLATAPDGHYDLIVLDAYGSDSVPVHLLTREALQLYLRKLAPGGVIAFHVSNLHLDLRPVVATLAEDAGLDCIFREDADFPEEGAAKGHWPSRWAVMSLPGDLQMPGPPGRWEHLDTNPRLPVWTDDHSSILPLLDLRVR